MPIKKHHIKLDLEERQQLEALQRKRRLTPPVMPKVTGDVEAPMGQIPPENDAAFVAAMEDILEVYALPPELLCPLVCLDEFSKQLLSEITGPRQARPARPGRRGTRKRRDAGYVREGSASAFMLVAPHLGTRKVFVGATARRTALDYADAIKFLCDEMFPHAPKIRLVQDNQAWRTSARKSPPKPHSATSLPHPSDGSHPR